LGLLNRNWELIGKLGIVHFVESFKRASTQPKDCREALKVLGDEKTDLKVFSTGRLSF
jgi:hypothetical protein